MNRNQILKELGITPWVLKQADSSLHLDATVEHIQNDQPSFSPLTERTVMPSPQTLPTWVIVAKANAMQTPLFSKVISTIRKFGVEILTLEFQSSNWQVEAVKGDLLIAFGDAPGQFFSKEPSTAQELREIIFETSNHEGNDIPVLITHDIETLRNNPIKKRDLWNDLVMARSVYLEMN